MVLFVSLAILLVTARLISVRVISNGSVLDSTITGSEWLSFSDESPDLTSRAMLISTGFNLRIKPATTNVPRKNAISTPNGRAIQFSQNPRVRVMYFPENASQIESTSGLPAYCLKQSPLNPVNSFDTNSPNEYHWYAMYLHQRTYTGICLAFTYIPLVIVWNVKLRLQISVAMATSRDSADATMANAIELRWNMMLAAK
ncbi:hypothetical protein OGAPHI_000470 [Ogataea philodendri]|uniref:Uncharacterized protein n=1 Tax=Ogataea philodendri TaxID=1378263 RepID=A0A9P8PHA1_9ASCO|nr:uncharacterized protein OGAPHI_000470 [Ogataea philodendri]KAH3671247.1 hypothetical protein OGAPHI_000470 [Ogataea philodendri]